MRGTSDFDKNNYPYAVTSNGYTWYVNFVPENKNVFEGEGSGEDRRKAAADYAMAANKKYWDDAASIRALAGQVREPSAEGPAAAQAALDDVITKQGESVATQAAAVVATTASEYAGT
jgi:hypothetical protein